MEIFIEFEDGRTYNYEKRPKIKKAIFFVDGEAVSTVDDKGQVTELVKPKEMELSVDEG